MGIILMQDTNNTIEERAMENIHQFTGVYGQTPRVGILSDHLHHALDAGFGFKTGVDGDYVKDFDGDTALVLCSEIIEIHTEDGISDGRCGLPVIPGQWACEGHWFDLDVACRHGMSAALCAGPGHYPMDM
jgi:hypothetical protein